jgi:hypothetical protein
VKLGEYEGTSAHWLAQLLFSRMSDAWRSCRDVSERSHRDPRYTYAAKAIELLTRVGVQVSRRRRVSASGCERNSYWPARR